MAIRLWILLLIALPAQSYGQAQEPDARARGLMQEIRCVVCNAQSIADSDASLAADLRREVTSRIAAGESDDAIKASLRQRYGDQVLLEPPLRGDTLPLWAAPILLLAVACAISWRLFKRRRG